MFFDNFLELPIVASAFKGIKIAVGFLILDAAIVSLIIFVLSGEAKQKGGVKK